MLNSSTNRFNNIGYLYSGEHLRPGTYVSCLLSICECVDSLIHVNACWIYTGNHGSVTGTSQRVFEESCQN